VRLRISDRVRRRARNGVVLSLFDANQREEAERELEAALKDDPHNIQLLAGASYWYAAHGDQKRALDLAGRVVQVEPRHPWAQVALSRALIANEMPFDAERMMRFVRLYSHFPTLDYELANALAAEGFYNEAAEELARTFSIKGDQIETRLAGRTNASAPDFVSLLSPERRASLFEPAAADTPENARQLKGLLALHYTLRATETNEQRAAAEPVAAQAARDFASGDDAARAFRQLYAASRLLRRNVATTVALELVAAAPSPDAPTDQKKANATRAGNSTTTNAAGSPATSTRRARAGECALALDAESLSLGGGASAVVVASLEGGGDLSKITATTPNWSDIIVLREAASADAGTVKFTVTSISKNSGDYAVTVKSPCGAKKIIVTVK
jgi:tetratricopeptide (TPR) repeat protein